MFANGWTKIQMTITLGLIFFSFQSYSQQLDITVFDVRNTIALSDTEPTYKDYYLNAGSERGLRKGMIITVVRKMALYDSYQNKSPGDLEVEVAKIKIIHVQKGLSVARDHGDISRISHPILDNDFVMVGDELDLDSITTDAKEKKNAANQEGTPEPQVSIAPTDEQARQMGATFAIDFASKSADAPTKAQKVPVSTLQ